MKEKESELTLLQWVLYCPIIWFLHPPQALVIYHTTL